MAELNFNLYSVKHYAELVGKSVYTVRRWIAEGHIKARKDRGGRDWLILAKKGELSAFVKRQNISP